MKRAYYGRAPWSDAELSQLLELAGDIPGPLLHDTYNRWAASHGLPTRTLSALLKRIQKCGGSFLAIGNWMTTGAIAQALGLERFTVNKWASRFPGVLQPKQLAVTGTTRRGRIYISRASLRRFARQHPDQFSGIPLAALVCVLEDEKLAESIVAQFPQRVPNRHHRAVRCIETGQVFPTCKAAARATYISHCSISHAVNGRRETAAGLHWEAVA